MFPRHKFLRDQYHAMVLQATVQRAGIYEPAAAEFERAGFRAGLRSALEAVAPRYASSVDDATHTVNIGALADLMSRDHGAALRGGRFRIGPSQKALNLFLKYLWCSDTIPMPPHCPFDAVILSQMPMVSGIAWTRLDSISEYQRIVAAAREQAGAVSLAEWELALYDRVLTK